MTEAMLAEAIFGSAAYQQRVNSTCRRLIDEGKIKRRGRGGAVEPFTYIMVEERTRGNRSSAKRCQRAQAGLPR